jgi:hypothetical protein
MAGYRHCVAPHYRKNTGQTEGKFVELLTFDFRKVKLLSNSSQGLTDSAMAS